MARWFTDSLTLAILDDRTEHPVITVAVGTPDGDLLVMCEPTQSGTTLQVERSARAWRAGWRELRRCGESDRAGSQGYGVDGCRISRR
jgi:hypothetical protein